MYKQEEIKEVETIENKIKGKKCPKCGHESLTYKPFKKTEEGLRPAYCKCSNCGYSTPVADFDGVIIGLD